MGTTLTGTTPQDTYDSLIKVTDNGPLSGTAKYLSDGLGNDSVLALSTSKVGIATNTPAVELHVETSATGTTALSNVITTLRSKAAGRDINIQFSDGTNQSYIGSLSGALYIATGGANERMRITAAGNVGIGTSSPAVSLQVGQDTTGNSLAGKSIIYGAAQDMTGTPVEVLTLARPFQAAVSFLGAASLCISKDTANLSSSRAAKLSIKLSDSADQTDFLAASFTKNGLCFNSDTAAANALDDYEEGTFTPFVYGTSTSGTATYAIQNGRYTKIGRLVHFEIYLQWSSGTGTGSLGIGGLPFTAANSLTFPACNIAYPFNLTLAANSILYAHVENNATTIVLGNMLVGGSTAGNVVYDAAADILLSGTYSV